MKLIFPVVNGSPLCSLVFHARIFCLLNGMVYSIGISEHNVCNCSQEIICNIFLLYICLMTHGSMKCYLRSLPLLLLLS